MVQPKYSIICPVRNGMPYLEQALDTVLASRRDDFELLLSDDGSTDGSRALIASIRDVRVRKLRPPKRLSMGGHWDFAQSHARGTWQMFLGQDDALQAYFFEEADRLTSSAVERGIFSVVAKRAYVFWPGLEPEAPRESIIFNVDKRLQTRSRRLDVALALLSLRAYHFLPQMYTSSMVHQDLLQQIRDSQGGRLIVAHPQDASLAASILNKEAHYLYSGTPISWVGTSTKSAGTSVARAEPTNSNLRAVREDYLRTVQGSTIHFPQWAGDFTIGDNAIYFWQALVVVADSQGTKSYWLRSRVLAFAVLMGSFLRIAPLSGRWRRRLEQIRSVAESFKLNLKLLAFFALISSSAGFATVSTMRFVRRHIRSLTSSLNEQEPDSLYRPYSNRLVNLARVNEETLCLVRTNGKGN